jgi:hypothetical protein
MWRDLLPQVPQYLLLGKGYGINARDFEELNLANSRSDSGVEGTELVGDYHNGPLSVIIPFGAAGAIGFLWFVFAGGRVLYLNYRYGEPLCQRLNTFLLAYYVTRLAIFFFIFGGLSGDLAVFTGILGLSVCVNGGVAKPVVAPRPTIVYNRFRFPAGARTPARA